MESPREWKSGKIFLSGVFPYSVTPVFAISFRIRISCLASLISETASVFECTEISKSCCQYKWNQSPREIVITNRFFPACYKRLCHLQEIPAKKTPSRKPEVFFTAVVHDGEWDDGTPVCSRDYGLRGMETQPSRRKVHPGREQTGNMDGPAADRGVKT